MSVVFTRLYRLQNGVNRLLSKSSKLRIPQLSSETNSNSDFPTKQVRYAGHSHWQNMRHIKAANDAKKGQGVTRIRVKIKAALQEGGTSDPNTNRELERVFQHAKLQNISLAWLKETVKNMTSGIDAGAECMVEARGPGGSLFIIQCFTDNANRARKFVKAAVVGYGGVLVDGGKASHLFDHKGVVYVTMATDKLDLDTATEIAIEAGAEDVSIATEADQQQLKFVCETNQLHNVKKHLQEQSHEVTDAKLEFFPHYLVKLSELEMKAAVKILESLMEAEDVVRVYDNLDLSET